MAMEFSNDRIESIKRKLDAAIPGGLRCAGCGSVDLEMSDRASALVGVDSVTRELDLGQIQPVVTVACRRCGWMRMHSLIALGEYGLDVVV